MSHNVRLIFYPCTSMVVTFEHLCVSSFHISFLVALCAVLGINRIHNFSVSIILLLHVIFLHFLLQCSYCVVVVLSIQ